MIHVQVDEEAIKKIYQEAINRRIEELDKELVFWDSNELKRRTCLSWNTIQDTFFHDERFPKVKVGGKWLYPAKEAEKFLIEWMNERR
ncbi:group-specific protein [Virgibacillus sp. AGTR]|uniref:group-specific protein n=1 Tax=Virgibacillus sp. AGTR TaxID=2812055 RepID=UPI001D16EA5C|nr:group-specific protein [Virgibacillus sp. AGTR]MCC2248821.1 group-specific protein [Virgibacillus sp. AGTR]